MTAQTADIIDLLSDARFDRQMFGRIRGVINARLIDGRLYLELFAEGGSLPPGWITTLSCVVTDPRSGFRATAPIDAVLRQEAGHVAARTEPLDPPAAGPETLSDLTKIKLISASGLSTERLLRPLLQAKPQP